MLRTFLFIFTLSQLFSCAISKNPHGTDYWKAYYQEKINPNNRLIDASPVSTMEQKRDGSFLFKRYFYDTKTIVEEIECAANRLDSKEGSYKSFSIDGKLWSEGQYMDNEKAGLWKNYHQENESLASMGSYVRGLQEGIWKSYHKTGELYCEESFKNGKLHGWKTYYDADGNISSKRLFEAGEYIRSEPEEKPKESINESSAYFPGGEPAMMEFLQKTVNYPKSMRTLGIKGRVIVQFVIEKDGSISTITTLLAPAQALADEAIRVVEAMPTWINAQQNGEPVRQRYTLPIYFTFRG